MTGESGKLNLDSIKVGDYMPQIFKKGENEPFSGEDIKDNDVFWTVRLDKESYYDTREQDTAVIISQQVRIMKKIDILNYNMAILGFICGFTLVIALGILILR